MVGAINAILPLPSVTSMRPAGKKCTHHVHEDVCQHAHADLVVVPGIFEGL